jgi:hypothetical protein
MFRTITIAAVLATLALASTQPAFAVISGNGGIPNGLQLNGFTDNGGIPNGLQLNGLGENGKDINGFGENGAERSGNRATGGITLLAIELPAAK